MKEYVIVPPEDASCWALIVNSNVPTGVVSARVTVSSVQVGLDGQ